MFIAYVFGSFGLTPLGKSQFTPKMPASVKLAWLAIACWDIFVAVRVIYLFFPLNTRTILHRHRYSTNIPSDVTFASGPHFRQSPTSLLRNYTTEPLKAPWPMNPYTLVWLCYALCFFRSINSYSNVFSFRIKGAFSNRLYFHISGWHIETEGCIWSSVRAPAYLYLHLILFYICVTCDLC